MKDYADYYYSLGLNVTCNTNKKTIFNANSKRYKRPSHRYDNLFFSRQTKKILNSYDWENAIGLGTLCGQVFENEYGKEFKLVVLDFDLTSLGIIEDVLKILGLPIDYEWVVSTGSKMGFHIYLLLSKYNLIYQLKQDVVSYEKTKLGQPPIDFERVEIMLKSHVVLPPSVHASTYSYDFVNTDLPVNIPLIVEEDNFYSFIDNCCDGIDRQVLSAVYFSVPNLNATQKEINKIQNNAIHKFVDKIIIDIETNGLINNGKIPKVLQIAWYCLDKYDIIIKKEVFSIKNTGLEKNDAFHINQLSVDLLYYVGYELNEVFKHLNQYTKFVKHVICYNKEFDLTILNHYLSNSPINKKFNITASICLMTEVAKNTLTGNYIKLEDACKKYGIKTYEFPSHIAESDVYKTYKLYLALKKKKHLTIT